MPKEKALQIMRSWFTAMPGEVLSCIGCHEDRNMVAIPRKGESFRESAAKGYRNGRVKSVVSVIAMKFSRCLTVIVWVAIAVKTIAVLI